MDDIRPLRPVKKVPLARQGIESGPRENVPHEVDVEMSREQFVQKNIEPEKGSQEKESPPETISVFIILAGVFLLPLFFIPLPGISIEIWKVALSIGVALLSFIFFLWVRMTSGNIVFPRPLFFWVGTFFVLSATISAIYSGNFLKSFIGDGSSLHTVFFSLSVFLLALVTAATFKKKNIRTAFLLLMLASVLLFFFQLVHIFSNGALTSFGYFVHPSNNLIGKWSDLGMFSGLVFLVSLVFLRTPQVRGYARYGATTLFALSIFFLVLSYFTSSWTILAAISLFLTWYFARTAPALVPEGGDANENINSGTPLWRRLPRLPMAAVVLCTLLIFLAVPLQNKIFVALELPPIREVRPSLDATKSVATNVYREGGSKMLFGAGPAEFTSRWLLYRPGEVNQTGWWNVNFASGIGTIPSSFATLGLVGGLLFVGMFLSFIISGVRFLRWRLRENFSEEERGTEYLSIASFIGAFYLWILLFMNSPSAMIVTFTFLFTGLFFASLVPHTVSIYSYNFLKNRDSGFSIVVFIIFFILLSISGLWFNSQKYRALVSYREALNSFQAGDFEGAEIKFLQTLDITKSDAFYRSYALLQATRMNALFSQENLSPEEFKDRFETLFAATVQNARNAIDIDPTNHENWITYSNIFAFLVPMQIEGVSETLYQNAKDGYLEAVRLNPKNPSIPLMLARLELSRGNAKEALSYLEQTVALKPDYYEALSLFLQVELTPDQYAQAIKVAEETTTRNPNNPDLLFNLGFLKYRSGDFEGARTAFEGAVSVVSDYANAKYFLGLSYAELGLFDDAVRQFEDVQSLNPENSEVPLILQNLRERRPPFSPSRLDSDTSTDTEDVSDDESGTDEKSKTVPDDFDLTVIEE